MKYSQYTFDPIPQLPQKHIYHASSCHLALVPTRQQPTEITCQCYLTREDVSSALDDVGRWNDVQDQRLQKIARRAEAYGHARSPWASLNQRIQDRGRTQEKCRKRYLLLLQPTFAQINAQHIPNRIRKRAARPKGAMKGNLRPHSEQPSQEQMGTGPTYPDQAGVYQGDDDAQQSHQLGSGASPYGWPPSGPAASQAQNPNHGLPVVPGNVNPLYIDPRLLSFDSQHHDGNQTRGF